MITLTSETHPLRVDSLPLRETLLRGDIGLTFAPGKKHHGLEGLWHRDLGMDLDRLRAVYHTRLLVCLIEDHELDMLGIAALFDEAGQREIEVARLPLWYAAPSQVAADLLTSAGRGPAEGEELINWMRENERAWRK